MKAEKLSEDTFKELDTQGEHAASCLKRFSSAARGYSSLRHRLQITVLRVCGVSWSQSGRIDLQATGTLPRKSLARVSTSTSAR